MAADDYTLTIRVHDPLEKTDHTKSAEWVTISLKRGEIAEMTQQDLIDRYLKPAVANLHILKFKENNG